MTWHSHCDLIVSFWQIFIWYCKFLLPRPLKWRIILGVYTIILFKDNHRFLEIDKIGKKWWNLDIVIFTLLWIVWQFLIWYCKSKKKHNKVTMKMSIYSEILLIRLYNEVQTWLIFKDVFKSERNAAIGPPVSMFPMFYGRCFWLLILGKK